MNLNRIAVAFAVGRAYGLGRFWAKSQGMAQDADRWITVHPNGKDDKGTPVKLDAETGEVKAGMGGKFNGKHISAVPKGGSEEQHGAQAKIDRAKAVAGGWEPKKKEPAKPDLTPLLEKRTEEFSEEEQKLDNEGFQVKEDDFGLQTCIKSYDEGDLIIARSKYGYSARVSFQDKNGVNVFENSTSKVRGNYRILEDFKAKIAEARQIAKNGVRDKLRDNMSSLEHSYDRRFDRKDYSTKSTRIDTDRTSGYVLLDGGDTESVDYVSIAYRDEGKKFGDWTSLKVIVPKDIPSQLLRDILDKHLNNIDADSYRKQVNQLKKAQKAIEADVEKLVNNYPKYQYQLAVEAEREAKRKERDKQAALGADSARTLKNTLGEEAMSFIDKSISSAPKDVAAVWEAFANDKIHIVEQEYSGTANFDPNAGGMSVNVKKIFDDVTEVKGSTLFHESFHNIDWLSEEGEGNYFSVKYKDGLFGKTLRSEVNDFFKVSAQKLDAIYKNSPQNFYEQYHPALKPATAKKVKDGLVGSITPSIAASIVKWQMKQQNYLHTREISDIVHGATKGKIHFGAGHFKPGYWESNGGENLAIEAFANIAEAAIVNKEAYNLISKIVPKSLAVFHEMMNELGKRYA